MAKQRRRPVRRRDRKGGPSSGRRKPCPYCRDKIEQVDYKDVSALRRFIQRHSRLTVLTGAGVMIQAVVVEMRTALGFNPHRVLTAEIRVSGARYAEPKAQAAGEPGGGPWRSAG